MNMEPVTSMREVPPLVDSDIELWTDCLGDYISVWLRNSPQFIQEQQQKMLRMALCPFLFGITCNLPHVWQEILCTCGVIEKERENKTTCLNESELESLEMAETVFIRCSQLVENKNDLKTILNFIYDVEERSALLGRIDINYALQEVVSLEVFASMWAPIKRFYERRKKQAHICIIYYFKIISHQIILYGRDGVDTTENAKRVLSDFSRAEWEKSLTVVDGNRAFNDGDYKLAVTCFSSVIEREPFNSLLYSNRAQAYLNLCDYRSALCDSKRAIILDPKNSKHYYRAAKSYFELGQVDKAEDTNNQALECCTDPEQREAVLQQSQEIRAKSKMTKARQNLSNSESEEREVENTPQVQYTRLICEGSHFYLSGLYSKAVEPFKCALNMIARPGSKGLIVEETDLLVVWFVYGLSCVKTGSIQNLQTAVEKFHTIITRSDAFPAVYYGLGLAYMAMKRYMDAEEMLKIGLEKIRKTKDSKAYYWPKTNKLIEETDLSIVKKLMEDMIKECMYPPKPDAVCKFHADTDNSKKEIYFSDPDYKGYICIKCRADCSIEFHAQCWKTNENSGRGKHNWKDLLDTPCPTPGCWGLVSEVHICKPDQEKSLKLSSQVESKLIPRHPLPKLKMKTESITKLERKMEKKRLRKERREELQRKNQELEDDVQQSEDTAAAVYQTQLDEEIASRNKDRTGTVLRKDETEVLVEQRKQKTVKIKKKEKKQKQFLTVNVQFKGDEDKERYGVNSLDDDGDFVDRPPTIVNPGLLPIPGSGLLPEPGTEPAVAIKETQAFPPSKTNWIDLSLYDFFYNILIMNGPMDMFSKDFEDKIKHLSEETQTRIHSCGGLASFFSSSPRFTVSQNNIVSVALPGQQGAPHPRHQVNPWEKKTDKQEESQYNKLNQWHTLNPAAKEFVPQESAPSSVLSDNLNNHQDVLSDSNPSIAKSDTSDLPAPAEDSDDSFTPVVNKRHLRAHNMHSAVHPDLSTYHALKPASSYKSVEKNSLQPGVSSTSHCTSINSVDSQETELSKTVIASGGMDSLDDFLNDSRGKKPSAKAMLTAAIPKPGGMDSLDDFLNDSRGKKPSAKAMLTAAIPKPAYSSVVFGSAGHSSSVSEASGDDINRGSSPALSTNSGSSSSRADGSQLSGVPPALRPLKAPGIVMPSRGKKKRPVGHISSKFHGHHQPPSTDDWCEVESVSSTTSDRDSNYGDPRPLLADRSVLTPLRTSSDRDNNSTAAGMESISAAEIPDIFSSIVQDSFNYSQYHKKHFGLENNEIKDMNLSHTRKSSSTISGTIHHKQINKMWSLGCPEDIQKDLTFKKSSKEMAKSDYVSDGMQEIDTENENLSSVTPSIQLPVQQPQSWVLGQVASRSETTVTSEVKKLPDSAWSSWKYFDISMSYSSEGHEDTEEVTVPPSDPWLNKNEHFPAAQNVQENPHIEKFMPSYHSVSEKISLQESAHLQGKQNHSNLFQPLSLSRNYGHVGSGKLKQNDSWASLPASEESRNSPSSFLSDMTRQENIFWSPFKAWKEAPVSSTSTGLSLNIGSIYNTPHSQSSIQSAVDPSTYPSTSAELPLYTTSSTYTPHSKESVETTITAATNTQISHPLEPSDNFKHEGRYGSYKSADPKQNISSLWQDQGDSTDIFHFTANKYKTAEIQTSLSGTEIEDMLAQLNVLKEALALKEATVKETLYLQETLKNCQEQLLHEKMETENQNDLIRKLNMRIQIVETSAEKWKNDLDQSLKVNDHLKLLNQIKSDEVQELSEKLEEERIKFLNVQMEMLELKKAVATNRIELKKQEASQHLQRLANVITQSTAVGKTLPNSVYEKHTEFSTYITSCNILVKQVEVNAQRLKDDLKQGLIIDKSDIDVNLPVFPKPPSESVERPQVSSTSDRQANLRNGTFAATAPITESQNTVSSAPNPAVQSDDGEDDDSKAYLSMFCSDKSSSDSGDSSSLNYGSGASQFWSDEPEDRKQQSFYAPGRDVHVPFRPISPAHLAKPSVGIFPGLRVGPGKGVSMFQTEASRVIPTPVIKPQVQLSKVHVPQKVQEKVQQPNPQQRQQKPYFERIVETVQEKLPGYSRYHIQKLVDKLRKNSGGSLTGWTFETLANKILDMILDGDQEENLASGADLSATDEQLSKPVSGYGTFDFLCSICQCDIEPFDALTLSCGHKFHDLCVQKWLESDRSCPNCRSHALLPQEFPALK